MGITSGSHVRVNESIGFVEICVEADHETQTTYEVVLGTTQGTAIGKNTLFVHTESRLTAESSCHAEGRDYEGEEQSLLFALGFGKVQCAKIPVLQDNCLEQMESFNVTLSADHTGVQFEVHVITVYILDDSGRLPLLGFKHATMF